MAKLHRGGRTRAWIGRLLGGDATLGDRAWRRALHLAGAAVLLVYVLPANTFGPVPVRVVLLLALAGVLLLELLRRQAGWELPTIRPHEHTRIASFALYAVGLVVAVLVFPEPVAVASVLGAAIVDPLLGELRLIGWTRLRVSCVGLLTYFVLAGGALALLGAVTWPAAAALGAVGAAIAVGVE
ncbi:MAG TPA: hypothetical protein VMH90_05395, partial [Thermoplasmata archaeon]|nr:hypothetical protein [Thermoplasmata archaeon]